jgi:hypothetical protein
MRLCDWKQQTKIKYASEELAMRLCDRKLLPLTEH